MKWPGLAEAGLSIVEAIADHIPTSPFIKG